MSNLISAVTGTVKNWWVFLILGILLLISSYWMFTTPVESFIGLASLFSALIFVSGLFNVFFALTNKEDIENFGLYLAGGIFDVIIGFILLKYPGLTIVLFSMFIGFWLLFRGFNLISVAFNLKSIGASDWGWILLFGILVVIFAMMSIINPLIGASYLVYTLAFTLLLLGVANITLALRLRKIKSKASDLKDKLS
ncbi:HdeD family acid-resistance protein [Lutimonas sp.]|uniref:HdeD family acid-resistance protein n=1 Tax=Lutimonas sp. TaxID=1872403 RepID=UPI003D9ABBD8